jgi:hypothetical protein
MSRLFGNNVSISPIKAAYYDCIYKLINIFMRLHEFINDETMDLHSWSTLTANKIRDMIDSGEIPNNPDSIRNAAKQLALDCYDDTEQLDHSIISNEVERMLSAEKLTKKAHLSGQYS